MEIKECKCAQCGAKFSWQNAWTLIDGKVLCFGCFMFYTPKVVERYFNEKMEDNNET